MKRRKKLTPRGKRVQKKIREMSLEAANGHLSGADIRLILRKVR